MERASLLCDVVASVDMRSVLIHFHTLQEQLAAAEAALKAREAELCAQLASREEELSSQAEVFK